jgi:acetyltransferase
VSLRGALERFLNFAADRLHVRRLAAEDASAYTEFLGRIDERDLRRRFAGPAAAVRDARRAWSLPVDHDDEVTFVAVQQSAAGSGEIVGEARAYRYAEVPTVELGIVVRSDMKRRGVGRALMDAMIAYTQENGLELIGQIAPDNAAMLALAERCGMDIEHPPDTDIAVAHMTPGDAAGPA